ncbi:MAG: M48 family metallopeptidase [Betaproteobacteria bacterium]|nr:M48 family metallopeptidase [Betaproteobacteria bacterium]
MQPFTLIFVAVLAATTALKLWLAARHIRHIRAHRGAVPADFAAQVDLASHQKAADYSCAKTRLGVTHILLDGLVVLALTLGGGLQLASDLAAGAIENDLVRGVALIAGVVVVLSAIEIPLNLYRVFVIESRFGFNRMTLPMFCADLARAALIAAVLGVPLLVAVLWLMAQMGDYWWLYVWLAWTAFNLLVIAIFPTWIAPLFNKFTPLPDGALKSRIEALLAKCGFRSRGLFVMDGSKRSSHGNAYFTGFGSTKRIVFFDTLLSRLSEEEIEAVLAHELGHFRRRHVVKRIAWTFAVSLVFLWILGQLLHEPWFYSGLNAATPSTAMGLLLFFLVVPQFTFPLQPVASVYSRRHEFEADRYAAEHASGADLVRALVKLYQDNAATLTPDPLHSAFYDSHPPAAVRIAHLQQAIRDS